MENVEGKGSIITVSIPVQAADAVPEKHVPDEIQKKDVGTILIAEDDPINLKVLKLLLRFTGYTILEATNGREAVELWKSGHPDVTLMDIQMPVMDGLNATRLIRTHEVELGLAKSVIYGLTAHVHEDDVKICLAAGLSGHIGKPIEFNLLKQTLQKHLAV